MSTIKSTIKQDFFGVTANKCINKKRYKSLNILKRWHHVQFKYSSVGVHSLKLRYLRPINIFREKLIKCSGHSRLRAIKFKNISELHIYRNGVFYRQVYTTVKDVQIVKVTFLRGKNRDTNHRPITLFRFYRFKTPGKKENFYNKNTTTLTRLLILNLTIRLYYRLNF